MACENCTCNESCLTGECTCTNCECQMK